MRKPLRVLGALGIAWCLLAGGNALAQEAADSAPVEEAAAPAIDPLEQYSTALDAIESLRTYNRQMNELVQAQLTERESLGRQLEQIELVRRGVLPLMEKMVDALENFVELDVPFKKEERMQRLGKVRDWMLNPEKSSADKYRRIVEAYQIENEYGREITSYNATLDLNGEKTNVNFLQVGRVAFVYQTPDESEAGVWNQKERRWDPLDSSYRSAIRQGLRIARKQAAPDLLRLPLPAAEEL